MLFWFVKGVVACGSRTIYYYLSMISFLVMHCSGLNVCGRPTIYYLNVISFYLCCTILFLNLAI